MSSDKMDRRCQHVYTSEDCPSLAVVCEKIEALTKTVRETQTSYVTRIEFWPVKTLVYGFVGLILIAFVGGLVALVFREQPKPKSALNAQPPAAFSLPFVGPKKPGALVFVPPGNSPTSGVAQIDGRGPVLPH